MYRRCGQSASDITQKGRQGAPLSRARTGYLVDWELACGEEEVTADVPAPYSVSVTDQLSSSVSVRPIMITNCVARPHGSSPVRRLPAVKWCPNTRCSLTWSHYSTSCCTTPSSTYLTISLEQSSDRQSWICSSNGWLVPYRLVEGGRTTTRMTDVTRSTTYGTPPWTSG